MLTKEEQMEPEKTCTSNDTTEKMKLYMAMELGQKEWKLGCAEGKGGRAGAGQRGGEATSREKI